jgi:hypothetical protein
MKVGEIPDPYESRYRFLTAPTEDEIIVRYAEGNVQGKLIHIELGENKIPYVCFYTGGTDTWSRSAQGYRASVIDKMIEKGIPIRDLQVNIADNSEEKIIASYSTEERVRQLRYVNNRITSGMAHVEPAVSYVELLDITAGMHVGKPQEFFKGHSKYTAEFFMGQYVSGHRQGNYIAFNALQNAIDTFLKKYDEGTLI